MAEIKLNERQLRFCREYIVDLNATASYKRAGYTAKGNAAEVNAIRLLSNAKVQAKVQELMSIRARKVEITAEDVLQSILSTKAICNKVLEIEDDTGQLIGVDRTALNGIQKADEMLGKHLKLFTDKAEIGRAHV